MFFTGGAGGDLVQSRAGIFHPKFEHGVNVLVQDLKPLENMSLMVKKKKGQ